MILAMARVLITGCSSGFGRVTAEELTDRGHDVIATARELSVLRDLDVAQRLSLDITDQASIEAAMEAAGQIDVLVNNAGIAHRGPMESYPLDLAEATFATNTFGPLRMIQAVAHQMRSRGSGVIVNVSSLEGVITSPLNGIYSGSKRALEAISESLHYELGHFGVRVVIVAPGYFSTAMHDKPNPIDNSTTPYAELHRQWSGAAEKLVGGPRPSPEPVAKAIADAIENPDTPLRVIVGNDAVAVADARKQLDDAEFEAAMRATLGIDW